MRKIGDIFEEGKEARERFFYDHPRLKFWFHNAMAFFFSTVSALAFAIGFNLFMNPGGGFQKIVTGGVSGVSQSIVLILELCGLSIDENLALSILYFVINIPILFLAWFGVGKRFAIFTLINVAESSIFIRLLTIDAIPLFGKIAEFIEGNGAMLSRSMFGGVFVGLSSAIAFKGDFSTGGLDVVAYYIALRKKTLVGKYTVILNSCNLCLFVILTCAKVSFDYTIIDGETKFSFVGETIGSAFFTVLYFFMLKFVVDAIDLRNKKVKVEIVSENPELGGLLVQSLPHACTKINATGVYSGQERFVFVMVASTYELQTLLKVVKRHDPKSFVQVLPLSQVEGRFYVKPIE